MLIQHVCKHRLMPLIKDRVPFLLASVAHDSCLPNWNPDKRFYRIQTCCMWSIKTLGPGRWRGSRFRLKQAALNQNQAMVKAIHKVLKIVDESQQTWKEMTNFDKNTYLHSGKSPHCLSSFNWSRQWSSMRMWWKHFKTCNFCMLTQECKRYLIHEQPSAVVSIDAYLSGPTYPYLSIPIQSSPISVCICLYQFIFAGLCLFKRNVVNISIAKAVIAAQLSSKGPELIWSSKN